MSKHRCRTCKGREGCYHLVIFNLAKDEDTKVKNLESNRLADKENLKRKTNVETDLIEDDATLDGNVAPKAKSKKLKLLNPENFSGAEANVFRQNFEYPPSKEDKVSNNKINKEETLFPNKMMIPPGLGSEKCLCGNTFESVAPEIDTLSFTTAGPPKIQEIVIFPSIISKPLIVIVKVTTVVKVTSWSEQVQPQHNRKAKCTLYQWIF